MKNPPKVRLLAGLFTVVLPLMIVGCVPYQTYENLKNDHARLKGANDDLAVKYNRAVQDLIRLNGQLGDVKGLREANALLKNENNNLVATLQRLNLTKTDKEALPTGVTFNEGTGELEAAEDLLFNPGEATLRSADAKKALDFVFNLFQTKYPNDVIVISGHTDRQPLKVTAKRWGTNQRLGFERAYQVFDYFLGKGILESRMVVYSYSFNRPVEDADTKEAYKKNRRVSFARSITEKQI